MMKSDTATHVAAQTSLSNADAAGTVDAVLSAISDALARGESVSIAGFGSFSIKSRTGETITIAASKALSSKAGKALRDAVR